ncbi:MAG: hypothetical protein AAF414_00075 [Pseudomonadota bacterium]
MDEDLKNRKPDGHSGRETDLRKNSVDDRKQREASALRANLAKRKAQKRARNAPANGPQPD